MRTISILIFSLIFNILHAQEMVEKEVKTEVNEAIVFLDGAQVLRNKNVNLQKGMTIIKFSDLSPFIDAKSVQLKAKGELTVLSVNHQLNYANKSERSTEVNQLVNKIELIETKITLENTHISIIKDELAFLEANRAIGGKNDQLTANNLQQTAEFYGKKLSTLKLNEIERNSTLKDLYNQKSDLENQIRNLSSEKEYPSGEVWVKVDAKEAKSYPMELSYFVNNASWFPTYDIRAKSINEPIRLIYKANVTQNTRVDWTNVKLTFSTADPNTSGVAPELQTYYLDYNSLPPTYNMKSNSVTGRVTDYEGNPLPGASVVVNGTTIGAATDMDGNYSITIPNNASQLVFSFVGFRTQTLVISGESMFVSLEEQVMALQEVVSMGYENAESEMIPMRSKSSKKESPMIGRMETSLAIPLEQVEKRTSVSFEIETPYSIKSGNQNFAIDMDTYELPANYEYYCVPKINKDAFLIANIQNWEKYNLLDGEANVFFEDTYIGKTLLDLRNASDTLQISLGRDKKVSVNREKIKDYSEKSMFGKKKEETIVWKTTVKNNKNQEIKMILIDQVPVSTMQEIEIGIVDLSGAKHDTEKGEIKWEFSLEPSDNKELELKYTVKYPKNRHLVIE